MARIYLRETDPLFREWTRSILLAAGHSVVLRLRPEAIVDAAVVSASELTPGEAQSIQEACGSTRVILLAPAERSLAGERLLGPGTHTLLRRDERPFLPGELLASLAHVLSTSARRSGRPSRQLRTSRFESAHDRLQ